LNVAAGEGSEIDGLTVAKQLIRENYDPSETWEIYDHDAAPFYSRGSILMIGDAAHATSPHIGNGAAQAIEDAAVLCALFRDLLENSSSDFDDNSNEDGVEALKKKSPALFKAFDQVRRERSQKVVEMSRVAGDCYGYDFDSFLAFGAQRGGGDRTEVNGTADSHTDGINGHDHNRDGEDIVQKLKEKWMKFASYTNDVDLLTQNQLAVEAFQKLVKDKGMVNGHS
jgi:hypothetical protein